MKKILVSAALLAIFAASCQNEAVIEAEGIKSEGELFKLEVDRSTDSRTTLEGAVTNWSEGDQLYVCGRQGQVHGILTLKNGAGTASGTFEGYIRGGSADDLQHVVFPAPEDGVIDMGARGGKLNIPMIGSMDGGAITGGLKNVGGIVTFEVEDGIGYPAKALADGKNLACGKYTFNPSNGTLTYTEGNSDALVGTYVNGGKAYLPVATTFSAIGSSSEASSINNVTVEVLVDGVPVSINGVTVDSGKIYGDATDGSENTDALDVGVIDDEQRWYAAFNNGGIYKLTGSFEVAGKVALRDGKTLTILGNNNKLTFKNEATEGVGQYRAIGVYGSSLTIKDLTMDVTAGESANGIYMEGNENSEGYLKLENCTMEANIKTFVLISTKSYAEITGGSYKFDGGSDASRYAIKVEDGARALINTTINGGRYGGGLTVHNSSAKIEGIHFEGGEENNQHGLHIWGSTVDYEEDAKLLYVDDVYVQTKSEGSGQETAKSVVNGATFEAGMKYNVTTGFVGTMKQLGTKIDELKSQQINTEK